MKKIRFYFRLARAFISRFKVLIVLGIFIGIAVFFLTSKLFTLLGNTGVETIGISGRYRTDNLPEWILNYIGEGLAKMDKDGIPQPSLAQSWETPDKGKTWIFRLKDGVIWQDGAVVDSQGISYEFSDVVVEKPDNQTVKFILNSPFSPFPSVVTTPTFKKGFLGTGEWRVETMSVSGNNVQKIILEKGREKKIIKFYPTEERAKLAYKLGQVDKLLNMTTAQPFDNWKTAKVESQVSKNRLVAVFFNTQDPVLSEKNLRQAMAYAIDKSKYENDRALSPISSESWVYNSQVKPYNYDVERAKSIIDELPKEVTANLNVRLVTIPQLLENAESIARDWEAIGIKTEVQVTSGIPDEYQVLLAVFDIPKDPDQYTFWHSTQSSTNITQYKNPRIDKLLEDGRLELNPENRKKIYLDFQRFLLEDSPAIFLYHPTTYNIIRK